MKSSKRASHGGGCTNTDHTDSISGLPDELLSRILSSLPTKDAAATRILSMKFNEAFTWITSLDFDDLSISYCLQRLHQVESFPSFVNFVDNVLRLLSHSQQPLTKFRLRVGGDKSRYFDELWHTCREGCFPDLDSARLNAWIAFPLARSSRLRELDLCILVNTDAAGGKLPHAIFACSTLEVLKLDSNLDLNLSQLSFIRLPNLRQLHLYSLVITDNRFVTRIVSICPSLEELIVAYCWWQHSDLTIYSPSLRSLVLIITHCEEEKAFDRVIIDTPNLQSLTYADDLASSYSITHMNALVHANITIQIGLRWESNEASVHSMLNLFRAVSNAQHLSLLGTSMQDLAYRGDAKDQLPLFRNVKTLVLGTSSSGLRCDQALWEVLSCSPCLETLSFPEGLFVCFTPPNHTSCYEREAVALEYEFWRTAQAIPLCCWSYLKRIVVKNYFGMDRELNLVKFLLEKASVMQELVIYLSRAPGVPILDQMSFERTLTNLPRASSPCVIRVQ